MATPATAPVPETAVPAAAASATAPEEEYVWENGRRHINPKFKSPYTLPNDEQEAQRLDRQHKQFVATLHDSLYRVPLKKEDMKEVLDLGTGTGIWATDFAENFPEARVVGVDISAIQTRPRPDNCTFQIADFTLPSFWTTQPPLSYIHGRLIASGVRDWTSIASHAYAALAPGGYLEIQELTFPMGSDSSDGILPPLWKKYSDGWVAGTAGLGVDIFAVKKLPGVLEAAGFTDVKTEDFRWPNNPWPEDDYGKRIGAMQQHNLHDGLDSFSYGILTKGMKMEVGEYHELIAALRARIRDPTEKVWLPIVVVYARKPL